MNEPNPESVQFEHHLPYSPERFQSDLEAIRVTIIDLLRDPAADPQRLQQAWTVYATITERYVDLFEDTPEEPVRRARVQIEQMIDKAIIFDLVGDMPRYLEELDRAEGYASELRFDGLSTSLSIEITSKLELLDNSAESLVVKLRDYISFANREELRDLIQDGADAQDLGGHIYGMVLDEGGDPEEVLRGLGITD